MKLAMWVLLLLVAIAVGFATATVASSSSVGDGGDDVVLLTPSKLEMFVDELPVMPIIRGYKGFNRSSYEPAAITIGMFAKKWKFHRDLPPTPVFAYGTSRKTATVPGPTIHAMQGVPTYVTWNNHLPQNHIFQWDPTIPTAIPLSQKGIPTVAHLHGVIAAPESDGHGYSWFTNGFRATGPAWTTRTYHYPNFQHPGNLWYHDHAMGLTRVNILAGLFGAYRIRDPKTESPLRLPKGEFHRTLVLFDRQFRTNGSVYFNGTGNNPLVHPHWQPEYFGDVIIVNGKAWPFMQVRRRKYRFTIINTSNARYFRLSFGNSLKFVHVASDSAYLSRPVVSSQTIVAPSEIVDFVVDFSISETDSVTLLNDAAYPYPGGDPVNFENSQVMKFIIRKEREQQNDTWAAVPKTLVPHPAPNPSNSTRTRYITLYEYKSETGEPTHLNINGKSFDAPTTETPKVGATELWYVINLTEDNHPFHLHLGVFSATEQTELVNLEEFDKCMKQVNDAVKCRVDEHARGKRVAVKRHERGWKNVYKMMPGYVTKLVVRFAYIHSPEPYVFNATAEPGYAYHCHIYDHEDNVMMRPLKLTQ